MRLDTTRDAMSVDQPRAAKVEDELFGEYAVYVNGEWWATWTTKAEAEAHAKRINEALEWDGRS